MLCHASEVKEGYIAKDLDVFTDGIQPVLVAYLTAVSKLPMHGCCESIVA
jgi:hypothetical protein